METSFDFYTRFAISSQMTKSALRALDHIDAGKQNLARSIDPNQGQESLILSPEQ